MNLDDFIDVIFAERDSTREVVCITQRTKKGFPYHRGLQISGEWYVCISSVRVREGGLPRGVADCVRHFDVVFDDIGTKCSENSVSPHLIVETSPGNYQWHYLIEPTIVTKLYNTNYNSFIKAAAEMGYTDGGATGVQRLVRIPGSWHEEKKYETRVVAHNSVPRWSSFRALAKAMGVEFSRKRVESEYAAGRASDGIDEVGQWLMDKAGGRLRERIDGDLIAFQCPFKHGNGKQDGAAYWLGEKNFSCFHDTCKDRRCADYTEWIYKAGGPDNRPLVFKRWSQETVETLKSIAEYRARNQR